LRKLKPKAKKTRREKIALPDGMVLGDTVMYYDFGWRVGYLMDVRAAGHELGIKPVAAYKKSVHNLTWHKTGDVKPVEGINAVGPREVSSKVRKRNRRV